jgi:hypothetical protein
MKQPVRVLIVWETYARWEEGMAKEVVITIHGVNPDRGWQPAVHDVLKPHFDPMPYSYSDYDTIVGPIRAISNIWVLGISVVALVLLLDALLSGDLWKALICCFAFATAFPLGLALGWWRRTASSKRLMRYIGNKVQSGSPHVIAHSLGTYLVGRVIKRHVGLTFSKVLLVSSVLPPDFPWARIVDKRPRSVRSVRNEYGTSDWVVKAVGRIRWLARDLGPSGDVGFEQVTGLIHTCLSPVASCAVCSNHPVRVHNVPLEEYGHSEVFLSRRHARELWLPFLWGFPADEFNQYLENLRQTAEALRDKRWNDAEDIIDSLYESRFTWTHGLTLQESLRDIVQARVRLGRQLPHGVSEDQVISETRLLLPFAAADALAESVRPDPDENIAMALHPNYAMARAVDEAIRNPDSTGHD